MKKLNINNNADTLPECFGISTERMDELQENNKQAYKDSDTISEAIERAVSYAKSDEEAILTVFYLGRSMERINSSMVSMGKEIQELLLGLKKGEE